MIGFISSMLLAVLGVILYNIAQKLQPASVSPFFILAIAYSVAAIICIFLYFFIPLGISSVKDSLLPAVGLGVAAVVVELGFLLVYRSGWNVSIAAVFCTIAATLVLLPIGIVFLKERVSQVNLLGVLLCLVGLFLTIKK